MKVNLWTVGLAAAGVVSLGSVAQGEEAMQAVKTALSSTTLSGSIDTSVMWNPGTGNNVVPGFAFNSGKQDGFNVNAVMLNLERPLDEANWAAGYKVQLAMGPDASLVSQGTDSGWDSAYLKQAYVVLRAPLGNGLDFKVGRFDTILGYEVFESQNDPNYTRSYGYTIEPTQHTGVLVSYRFNDILSVSGGMANTSTTGTINQRNSGAESQKTYMGSLSITAPDDAGFLAGSTLYGGVIGGLPAGSLYGGDANDTPIWLYVGGTMATGVEGLRLGVCYDYNGRSGDDNPANNYYANAFAGYLSYTLTEKTTVHARMEYATFSQNVLSNSSGLASKVFALTGTVQYDLWQNVLSRLEARWDTAADGTRPYGGDVDHGPRKNYYTIALNVVYMF